MAGNAPEATGFTVAKDAEPEEVLEAILRVAAGDSAFSPAVLCRLVQAAVTAREASEQQSEETIELLLLTDRERDVLALIGGGLSNAQIAYRLHIGLTTVKTHVASLMAKTGTSNRVRLAVLALRSGLTGS